MLRICSRDFLPCKIWHNNLQRCDSICRNKARDEDGSIYTFEPGKKIAAFDFVSPHLEKEPMPGILNAFKLFLKEKIVMTCLPAQDDTLVIKKSRSRFPVDANDWKPFNKKVYNIIKEFQADGYKIVVFRCARDFPPRRGSRNSVLLDTT